MDNHNEILRAIGRLEGKVDAVGEDVKRINGSIVDLYEKTSKNKEEVDKAKGMGRAINIGWGAITVIVGWIMWYFGLRK